MRALDLERLLAWRKPLFHEVQDGVTWGGGSSRSQTPGGGGGNMSCVTWPTWGASPAKGNREAADGWKIPERRGRWSAKVGDVSKPRETPSLSNMEHSPRAPPR